MQLILEVKMPIMFWIVIFSVICKLSFSELIARDPNLRTLENSATDTTQKRLDTYIVHLGSLPDLDAAHSANRESLYASLMPKDASGSNDASRIVHPYRNVFNGFAARLTAEEVKEMQEKNEFLFVWPQKRLPLHTTHSPSFLGLQQNLGSQPVSNSGKGIIIGMLDTGIAPYHPSFSDEGLPPPPTKWKGKCESSGSIQCNNKLIGARNFVTRKQVPPTDEVGHGTHTASIAAGNFVENANVFGNANGTAVGMAPLAHLAMYKVCIEDGCDLSDVLAGMDAAIEDGVDVISISIGAPITGFFNNPTAIGAFHAIQKGIFVSCSAGNGGPFSASVINDAPWILTVGASTIGRVIRAFAGLGNGVSYFGQSAFQPKDFPTTYLPLVYAGAKGNQTAAFCEPGSLNSIDVRGKVVLCDRGGEVSTVEKGQTVKDAGGAGMILTNLEIDGVSTLADAHVLPAAHVSFGAGKGIKVYINSTSTPTANFFYEGTIIAEEDAPAVASFSSRGPSLITPGILKPDIIGPGVSILAAWPFSLENNTNTKSTFNILSGTSMSCPHLSGIAAQIKSAHPDWSPAAIKSAIMTTAEVSNQFNTQPIFDERSQPADVFAIGAGHVNPTKALDPGLVYDIQPDDYIPYLCGLGYADREIELIIGRPVKCSTIRSITEAELNYPSFSIHLGSDPVTYSRTLTNVGEANSVYYFSFGDNEGFKVIIQNSYILNFTQVNQKLSYNVTFRRDTNSSSNATFLQGSIAWISGKHFVRTPISVKLV